MITAVDTSVLLDVLSPDPEYGPASAAALRAALAQGSLMACEVVWAELVPHYPSSSAAQAAMHRLRLEFQAVSLESALAAGDAWKIYRRHGGPRTRVAADFLIGAHALHHADRLLTRDAGFYRAHFDRLTVLNPVARRPRS